MDLSLSCVIPTLARNDRVRSAVRAAASQTVPPRWIVVVDDSVAGTVDLAAASADVPHNVAVDVIRNERGGGASGARNAGAAHTTSDVIAFLDDDDEWEATYLARALAKIGDDGVDMVVTWSWLVFPDGSRLPGQSMREGLHAGDVLAVNPGLTGSNLVVTRAAFDAIGGFDADLPVSNDKDFLVRFLDAGLTYAVVPERLMLKTEHDDDRLTRPSLRRVAALAAYEQKYQHRLNGRQRWQLRAKRTRVRRRATRSPLRRAALTGLLAVCLIGGGLVEGLPRSFRRRVQARTPDDG